jgi:hypothetical protein
MQFIRLLELIYLAERILPEQVADWITTKSVQNIDISFVQKHQVNIPRSGVIEWSNSGIFYLRTFRNFTHFAGAIWVLSNHDFSWIIRDPDC